MPTKFQLITELYDQTVQSVTGSYQSWTGFLRAACYNYKCPFDDQILIYAQRPDATAVLEMERWNKRFGRWVNRGAKSIAVFGDDGQNCLKLYFDVSDTHASRFARPLPIWTMHPAFEPEVIETLEATFGNLAEKENLADAVRSACHNAVADNFTDYLQDLRECREDSLLEELDDLNLEVFYRDALEVSVAYMLMTRLGLRADDYFSPDEFAHVYEFNTPPTINALGIATSDIAEMGLREISRTVMQAQRDQFFANREKSRYDDHTEQHETGRERSKQYGDHLQDAERLSGAEPADAADAGGASGQVRGAAESVPEEAPQGALHQPQDQRRSDGASGRNRADRAEDGGADRGADGESRGRDGGTESDRSPALDGPDEQSPAQRGGAGAQRPDLRLTTKELTEAGSNELPAFVDHSGDYVLLDRLRADCDYFLGAGGRSEKHLWAGSVYAQIKKMRELYDALPEKPEWLTTEAIDRYAAQMAAPYQVAAYHHFENGFDDKPDYQTLEEAEAAAQGYRSPLDMLFRALEEEQPAHVAVKQYKVFKQAAGKTAKSILVTAAVRLAAFNIPQYAAMTSMDEMDFGSLGERKRAIFCVIPVNDSSMNYLVGMLYTQCFQELYRRADLKYNGRLPVPVRVIQDEWANVAQPESYPKILATCRSYNIGLNIIVQNVQQIKALYEKEHESIIGNCDTLLFLGGGNEPASLEFIVKLLGRETLATRTRGLTKGRNGSSTTNYQQTGRDLLTVDEVRKLDTNKAILFIRGEDPVIDRKYNLKRHPNIKLTSDGKAKPYIHKPQGVPDYALPDLPYAFKSLDDYEFIDTEDTEHESEQEEPLETDGAE